MITETKESKQATGEQVWEEYSRLKPADRKAVAERILLDKEVSEDFIDHVLIKKAKLVKGKPITLQEYKTRLLRGKS